MATYFERPERGWTPIPTELIRTTELSPVARLVLMHALSNRADWEEPAWRVAEILNVSRERVINALAELKKTGHARKTARVTIAGSPPRQGWDFAWPAFVEDESHRRISPSSENPTMAEPQVDPKVGFPHDGKTHRWETPSSDFPSMAEPTSGNPTPLLDGSSNQTVDQLDEEQNKTYKTPPKPPAEPAPEDLAVNLINFNDRPSATTPSAKPSQKHARRNYDYTPDFLAAWELYGRVGGKQAASRAWTQAIKRAAQETILAAIPHYLASVDNPRYTQHMSTWLNDDGWESASARPKKPGYQGKAGSDLGPKESYENVAKQMPIRKQMVYGNGDTLEMCRAWYYHWNIEVQRDYTEEQLLATGNAPDDVDWLVDAYAHGIDPDLYQRFLTEYDLDPHGSDD